MKTWYLILALALVGIALGGCATRPPVVVECEWPRPQAPVGAALVAQAYGAMTPIPLNAVLFTNEELARAVVPQQLSARRTPTNTVQVTARLINCTDDIVVLGARVNFMDVQNVPTEGATAWRNVILQPRSMQTYQESSMSKDVERYVVEVRPAAGG